MNQQLIYSRRIPSRTIKYTCELLSSAGFSSFLSHKAPLSNHDGTACISGSDLQKSGTILISIGGSSFSSSVHITPSNRLSPRVDIYRPCVVAKQYTSERLPLFQSRTGVAQIRTLIANYGFLLTLTAPWDIYINRSICSGRPSRCSTGVSPRRLCQSRDIIVIKSAILSSCCCVGNN